MKFKDQDIDIEKAINFANYDILLLKRRKNNMLLSDYQINVLTKNGINYKNYSNIYNLMFDIEECLNTNYDEELDYVGSQIAEFIYYQDTKK